MPGSSRFPTPLPYQFPVGRPSFGAYNRWVDDALRHRADGDRLLDPTLVSLPGVQRLARQRFRRSAFADVYAARGLRRQATERASAILTPRQVLVLQLYCEGQSMAAIAARLRLPSRQHLWAAYRRPAVEAVTRESLALAQGDLCSKWRRFPMPLPLERQRPTNRPERGYRFGAAQGRRVLPRFF